MAEHGSGGKDHKGAAIVTGVVATVIIVFLLYLLTGMKPPLQANVTEMVVGLVAFGLVFVVLARVVHPKFEAVYAERADRIDGGLARAEKLRAEAEDLHRQYEAQLAEARAEAGAIRDAARAEGAEIRAQLRGEAEAEATAIRARATEEIATQRASAAQSLHGAVGSLSTQLAEKILGGSLSAGSASTVQSYLAELGAGSRN
jgi:F-type H+-transporting ATPase subunit b